MKAREIILLFLIILAGVTITFFQSGRIHLGDFWLGGIFTRGEEFSFEESRTIEPPLPGRLSIKNPRGEIVVEKGEGEKIIVYWEKKVWAEREEEARETAEGIKLSVVKTKAETNLDVLLPPRIRRGYESNFRIVAPSSVSLRVTNAHGQVRVGGFSAAEITNTHGQVKVSSIEGDLSVQNRHGDINVTKVGGAGEIHSEHGNVILLEVEGAVRINARHGHLDLEGIGGRLEVNGEHLSVSGRNIKGPLQIATSHEPVDLREIGQAEITNRYSLIRVDNVAGGLTIRNRYATVDISSLNGDLNVSGKNLRVVGRAITGKEITISSAYDNVELKDFTGRTSISLRHGDCLLEPASLSAGLTFQGDYSSLRLFWPTNEAFPLEIRVRHGEIFWHLEEAATTIERNRETVIRAFSPRNEEPSIIIINSYGKVTIEKAALSAPARREKAIFP